MLTEKYITQIAAIDGAILLNEHGKIYAIGTILDSKMPEETGFDMARGARYNSAIKYSYLHRNKKNLCVVISEDGYVNFISNGKEKNYCESSVNFAVIINNNSLF